VYLNKKGIIIKYLKTTLFIVLFSFLSSCTEEEIDAIIDFGEVLSGSSSLSNNNNSLYNTGKKGCHVYGKIQFVEYGEDYKVKFVGVLADLEIKYVDLFADSPGEWDIVDYGARYKIKIVDFGQDFTVKEVSIFPGCK